uniref:hypothetical protein n=1 Tax=Hydrogenophaga sp. TaxID=1904254 RepID=UPI001693931D
MYANHIFMVGTEKGLGVNNEGVLSSAASNLELHADGRLINKGALIAGGNLNVKVQALHNGGRVYGEQVAIAAEQVVNEENAVIAARERLAIEAGESISNQRGALLLSAGDMALLADRVENRSARIEALGDLDIDARVLLNANEHLQTEVIRDGGATTTRTLYFTATGAVDATEVAWMAVKPVGSIFGDGAWDEYSAHGRSWLFTQASAQALAASDSVFADPRLATWYHGPEPYVAAGMVTQGSGDSETLVWAEAQFAYTRDDPIWAALGIAPPAGDAPGPMPRPLSADSEISGDTPQYREALQQWQAQAAPWVALGQKLTVLRGAINAELLPFDIYQRVTETQPTLKTVH